MPRPSHHVDDAGTAFINPWPSARKPTWKDATWAIPFSWYPSKARHDQHSIKVVNPDWGASKLRGNAPSHCIIGTWLGHATALAEFRAPTSSAKSESTYVLFDPIFSMRAGPNGYVGPGRFNKPPCSVQDLPGCDAVCISHNHYDHLDTPTVSQILGRFPDVKWFVPLGVKAWLLASGAKAENVQEMDWWQEWEGFTSQGSAEGSSTTMRVSCVPAQHTSGRSGLDVNSTLWCGWAIEQFVASPSSKTRRGAVYHAGDTGYRPFASSDDVCPAFKETGARYNGFDLSFIPIWRGGSLSAVSYIGLKLHHDQIPMWNHCSPGDAVKIHGDVKSRNTIAVHFGTFVGSQKESDEALDELNDAVKKAGLLSLEHDGANEKGRAGAIDIGQSLVIKPDDG